MDPCSHTFEHHAIEQWIATHHNCPTSGKPLETIQLVANISMRDACDSLRKRNITPPIENQVSLLTQQVDFLTQQMSKLFNRIEFLTNENKESKEERNRLLKERDELLGQVEGLKNENRRFREERGSPRDANGELPGRASGLARPAAQNGQSNVQLGIVQNGNTVVTNPLNSNENGALRSCETRTFCDHLVAAANIAVRTILCCEDK
jgi:FtsZ-binding cell division protein ZapB